MVNYNGVSYEVLLVLSGLHADNTQVLLWVS